MRVYLKRDHGKHKANTEVDLPAVEAADLLEQGAAISLQAREMEARIEAQEAARRSNLEKAIRAKVAEAKQRGAIPPKDTAIEAKCLEQLKALDYKDEAFTVIAATIESAQPVNAARKLGERAIQAQAFESEPTPGLIVELSGQVGLRDAAKAYIEAHEPIDKLVRAGDMKAAFEQSKKSSAIMAAHLMKPIREGGNYMLRDAIPIEAAGNDYTDPNSQVGILSTGLVLMRNLGFLKNKLAWLPYLTTDLRNEPASFGQNILTRYITPPAVATWVPGVGFTTDATTISANNAEAAQSTVATPTAAQIAATPSNYVRALSTPSTPDVNVSLNQFKGVPIGFPISTLAATVRNLFEEQRGAQLYTLAETINKFVLAKIFSATWTGVVTSLSLGSNFALPGMVTLKNRMTLSKIPDLGRFALLHSTFHDALLSDTNLLTAKAIMALINKDASAFEQGDVPSLFGIKPLESQLATYNSGTFVAPTINESTGAISFSGINQVGFAGNQASMVFAARVPQDFSKVAQQLGIPLSWAVEIVTEPDSGLSMMVFKNVNTGTMTIEATMCLMYGAAQGDPRVGIVLTP